MRSIVICSPEIKKLMPQNQSIETILLDGIPVTVGLVTLSDPIFDRKIVENRHNVLVKVNAFSCNYRDKALIFMSLDKLTPSAFYVMGSEFVGEIIEVGTEVSGLKIGDRVIGNNHFISGNKDYSSSLTEMPRIHEGVPTNHASREYQIFHQEQVIKIPRTMSTEVAAAFSIGAQTTYSMIRKAKITQATKVLVTAAKSNTSLFIINALRKYSANTYVTSTSMRFEKELKDLGITEMVLLDPASVSMKNHDRLSEMAREHGGMECVFDPFADLHLKKAIYIIAPQGRYITCGIGAQYQTFIGKEMPFDGLSRVELMQVITKNLQIIGNCLGTTQDLEQALIDYAGDSFKVVVDSVFQGDQVGDFFYRTYCSQDRFGKVVYRYD